MSDNASERRVSAAGLLLWESDLGSQLFSLRILAADGNVVYVADDLGVAALSDRDGSLLWRHNLGPIDSRPDIYAIASDARLLLSGEATGGSGVGGGGSSGPRDAHSGNDDLRNRRDGPPVHCVVNAKGSTLARTMRRFVLLPALALAVVGAL